MRKSLQILLFYGLIIFLSSCGSKQLAVRKNTADQLSKQIGFQVSPKDDLKLYAEAVKWLGVPYKYGGASKEGVDCSGLVVNIYKEVYHIKLNRQVEDIHKKDCRKVSVQSLKPGDLVFFDTKNKRRKINHTGIILKNDTFIHASSSRGVRLNKLSDKYYKDSFVKGGRVRGKK